MCKKTGALDNPCPYSLTSGLSGLVFIEVILPLAVPGFEPQTFGSEVPSLARVATEAAGFKLLKLGVILPLLFSICFVAVFSKCLELHTVPILLVELQP